MKEEDSEGQEQRGGTGRPTPPRRPIRRVIRYFRHYWRWVIATVIRNVGGHWPIFGSFLIFPLASGLLMYLAELGSSSAINSYPNAVYATWITMATVGYGDMVPVTAIGRVIASFDALIGLVLVGSLIWLVTSSLQGFAGLPDEVEYKPRTRDRGEDSSDEE